MFVPLKGSPRSVEFRRTFIPVAPSWSSGASKKITRLRLSQIYNWYAPAGKSVAVTSAISDANMFCAGLPRVITGRRSAIFSRLITHGGGEVVVSWDLAATAWYHEVANSLCRTKNPKRPTY